MEQAIEYALSEEKPLTPSSPESKQPSSDEPPSLTRREKEVAVLVARGLTNRQIASELVLSEHTVHHHHQHPQEDEPKLPSADRLSP